MNSPLALAEFSLPAEGRTGVWAAEVYKRVGGKEIHIVSVDVPGELEGAVHVNTIHRPSLKCVSWLRPESFGNCRIRAAWIGY